MSVKLETVNLTRIVDGQTLVNKVSVKIYELEVLVITGPSGSGKSSFLRMLNRLDEPTSGTVYLDGQDYTSIPPRELRKRVGFVPQEAALISGTVFDNIATGPKLRGEPVDSSRIRWLLEKLNLNGYDSREADDLSGGEKQRISLARTLLNAPEVLLLDEPTSQLDDTAEAEVESLLGELAKELNLTTIMVTHDNNQARRLGDRALTLRNGSMENCGPVEEVLS